MEKGVTANRLRYTRKKRLKEDRTMKELSYHWDDGYMILYLKLPEAPIIGKYGRIRHMCYFRFSNINAL